MSITLYFHCLHLFKGRKNQGPKGWDSPDILSNDISGVTQHLAELEPWLQNCSWEWERTCKMSGNDCLLPSGQDWSQFFHPQRSLDSEWKHSCKVQFSLCSSGSDELQTHIPVPFTYFSPFCASSRSSQTESPAWQNLWKQSSISWIWFPNLNLIAVSWLLRDFKGKGATHSAHRDTGPLYSLGNDVPTIQVSREEPDVKVLQHNKQQQDTAGTRTLSIVTALKR